MTEQATIEAKKLPPESAAHADLDRKWSHLGELAERADLKRKLVRLADLAESIDCVCAPVEGDGDELEMPGRDVGAIASLATIIAHDAEEMASRITVDTDEEQIKQNTPPEPATEPPVESAVDADPELTALEAEMQRLREGLLSRPDREHRHRYAISMSGFDGDFQRGMTVEPELIDELADLTEQEARDMGAGILKALEPFAQNMVEEVEETERTEQTRQPEPVEDPPVEDAAPAAQDASPDAPTAIATDASTLEDEVGRIRDKLFGKREQRQPWILALWGTDDTGEEVGPRLLQETIAMSKAEVLHLVDAVLRAARPFLVNSHERGAA